MAYELNYFFDCSGRAAEELLTGLLQGLVDSGLENLNLVDVNRSTDWPQPFGDWVSAALTSAGRDTGVAIEIHADADAAERDWADLASEFEAPPTRPGRHLATCTLTLIGEIDRHVFEVIRSLLREQWAAVEHDETDGFTVT